MKRLWDWEENNYKQDKKREVLWTAAVICWLAALAETYWVEHTLYGEVIETKTFLFLGLSIGLPIGQWIRKQSGRQERPMTAMQKWVSRMIVVVSVAVLFWAAYAGDDLVYVTEAVCVLFVLYWAEQKKKEDADRISLNACTLLFAAVMLAIGAHAAPKVMGLTSTKQAEKAVTEQGYEEAEFLGWMYGRWVYQDAVNKSFYTEEMQNEKYYMLFARKDGEPWRFVIDPKGGEIIIAASEREEPELGNWYRSRGSGE